MTDIEESAESPVSESPQDKPRIGRSWLIWIRDVIVVILIALIISAVTKTFLLRSFYIPSGSMEETLLVQDRVLVNVLVPEVVPINRGDVVVFDDRAGWLAGYPKEQPTGFAAFAKWFQDFFGFGGDNSDEFLIKRVIGLPGDHVTCCNSGGEIEINGQPIDEHEYINIPEGQKEASLIPFDKIVPEGYLFVLGDNRNDSADSRYHQGNPGSGFVSVDAVVGRAFFISWPMKRWTWLDNYEHVFANTDN